MYKYDHTKLMDFEGKKFAFDFVQLMLAEVDDSLEKIFMLFKNEVSKEDLQKLMNEEEIEKQISYINGFAESDFFFSNCQEMLHGSDEFETGNVSMPTIHECNLRCKYCFASYGHNYFDEERKFPEELVEKALRYIYFEYMPNCKGYRVDFVSGGEPLLNFPIIKKVYEVGRKLYEETGKNLEMWLCTNGTILSDEILDFLNHTNISIGISIDGNREEHDRNRRDSMQNGTYDIVVANIKKILSSDTYSNKLKDIWGMVVVTPDSGSLVDILKHHKELGLKNVQMKLVRCGNERKDSFTEMDLQRLKKKYKELYDFFIGQMWNGDFSHINMILNDNDTFGKIIRRLLLRRHVLARCQAGKNKVSIAANGELYPCDSFVGNRKFKLGSIFDERNEEKKEEFNTVNVYRSKECSQCWGKYICGGDCYSNAYLVNNRILDPDKMFCELNTYLIELALMLVYHLNTNCPDYVKRIVKQLSLRDRINNAINKEKV